ncbi:NAD-binding protein [Haloarchaeobius baliensis]|uniref:NAD-binding protein n=1 Tax=Haloarchaeobius baliensis TaxID=1670458 RepID=UPI003F882017
MATTSNDGRSATDERVPPPEDGDQPPAQRGRQETEEAVSIVLVGGGHVGRALAEMLAGDATVRHIDTMDSTADRTTDAGDRLGEETVFVPDITSLSELRAQSLDEEDLVVVLTGNDARTLLVTQLLRTKLGVTSVCAVVVDPRNADAFHIPGVDVVCTASVLADAVGTEHILERAIDTTDSGAG